MTAWEGPQIRAELVERRGRLEQAAERAPQEREFRRLLGEVDAALQRLDGGTYGLCEVCHDPIEADRLAQDPLLRACLDHLSAAEQRALQHDLDLAGRIQSALLPRPRVEYGGWEVCRHFEPAGVVGGDYCDVILPDRPGGAFYVLIGDVAGKGIAASILMSNLHALFRTLSEAALPVDVLLERANRLFCQSTMPGHYATLVCAKAGLSGEVQLVNAGHCPVFLIEPGRITEVQATGLPLGMFCSSPYTVTRLQVEPGSLLFLYTDGLSEARNAEEVEYGAERLARVLTRAVDGQAAGAEKLVSACLDDLVAFHGHRRWADDLTIMAVRRLPTPVV
jgi:sigma-B regulation protein RsbU (phosphoserine phosphatase)